MFGRIKRDIYTFHLKNGRELKFKAQQVTVDHAGGKCIGYHIEEGVGTVPFYVDPTEIVAVTRKD